MPDFRQKLTSRFFGLLHRIYWFSIPNNSFLVQSKKIKKAGISDELQKFKVELIPILLHSDLLQ